jgi:hypothetical protein
VTTRRLLVDAGACVDRFRHVAHAAGAHLASHRVAARGPAGEELAIDIATIGPAEPARALVVVSGVHGVEVFAPSAAQCELLERVAPGSLPNDLAVVLVHALNPWGVAHGRRQNESNVDLNRNWRRGEVVPVRNEAYDEIHHLVCPDDEALPSSDDLLAGLGPFVDERGVGWVADAITSGQYHHPDGLHFGGDRTEESCAIVEREVRRLIGSVTDLLVVDLHTGHGPYGEMTLLSAAPVGSEHDRFLRDTFSDVDSSGEIDSKGAGDAKAGQVAPGIAGLVPDAFACSVIAEVGTTHDLEQLDATFHEQWVFRHGDPDDPAHRAVRRRYLHNFTPDDPGWEDSARRGLRTVLDAALAALIRR